MNVLFVILLGLAATEAPPIANAGFEEVHPQTGMPIGWSFTSLPDGSNLIRYEAKAAGEGRETRALSIAVAAKHPQKTVAYNAHQDLRNCVAGMTYRATANVRTQGLKNVPMIVIQCLDESGAKCLAFSCSPQRKLQHDVTEWEKVETEFKVPEGTSIVRLRIGIPAEGNAGGAALIDDVDLVEAK